MALLKQDIGVMDAAQFIAEVNIQVLETVNHDNVSPLDVHYAMGVYALEYLKGFKGVYARLDVQRGFDLEEKSNKSFYFFLISFMFQI